MKKLQLIAALSLISGSALAAPSVEWLPPANSDLVASGLTADLSQIPASRHTESSPITFSWAMTVDRQPGPQGLSADSRQYWVDVTGRTLAEGVDLPLTAPGAVIRVSALDSGSQLQLDPARLQLSVDRRTIDIAALQDVSTGAMMQRQGMSVPEDTLAFRLPADVDVASLSVRHPGAGADQALVIHVFEPNSSWVAQMSAPRPNFLAGQPIELGLVLSNGSHEFSIDNVDAMLVSPDAGQVWSLNHDGDRGLGGRVPLDGLSAAPGLYEAHAYIEQQVKDTVIRRDVKIAFSVAPPAGRFTGQVSQVAGSALGLDLGVEVVTAGRYQVNGEIFGTNAFGQLQPLALAQSAALLEPGAGSIRLELDPNVLKSSGLDAPFEVHNLQLLDQGRMYMLEERQRAIVIQNEERDQRREFLIER
ncbi:MAG: DUF4785 family protein [Wenzhouxiangella sp.]|nr:MAG: DUF4785 family protein [Wenzhouxiangella sp.]